jgi:hypothetical protein
MVGWFEQLSKIPGWSATRAHVEFLKELIAEKDRRIAELEQENARLKREATRSSVVSPADDLVEHEGLLWKRKPDGSFEETARCPECQRPMAAFPPGPHSDSWDCARCDLTTAWRPPPGR